MINNLDEQQKWENVNNERRKNYRRLWNKLKGVTDKAKT
jgi:hypothetical protein